MVYKLILKWSRESILEYPYGRTLSSLDSSYPSYKKKTFVIEKFKNENQTYTFLTSQLTGGVKSDGKSYWITPNEKEGNYLQVSRRTSMYTITLGRGLNIVLLGHLLRTMLEDV